jgi:hypothetical protein
MKKINWSWGLAAKIACAGFLIIHVPLVQTVDSSLLKTSKLSNFNDCAVLVDEDLSSGFEAATVYLITSDGKTIKRAKFFGPLFYILFRGTSGGAICQESDCENFTKQSLVK